jgi:predicted transcriptional regulator YheO
MSVPKTARERELVIDTLRHIVEGLGCALGRNVEVVLHDLGKPGASVTAIANGAITGRTIGSPIISGPFNDLGLKKLLSEEGASPGESHTVVSGYKTRSKTGHELDSTSVILRDGEGQAYAALCVNADMTSLRQVQGFLNDLLDDVGHGDDKAESEIPPNVDSLVQEIIEEGIRSTRKPVAIMTKEDKIDAVDHMNRRGLFLIRSSVDIAAASLGVSRFTIYNYLDELKRSVRT